MFRMEHPRFFFTLLLLGGAPRDFFSRLFLEIPRDVDGRDVLTSVQEQQRFQERRAVVVKEEVIPSRLDQFGDDDGYVALRVFFFYLESVVHDGLDDETERRFQHD